MCNFFIHMRCGCPEVKFSVKIASKSQKHPGDHFLAKWHRGLLSLNERWAKNIIKTYVRLAVNSTLQTVRELGMQVEEKEFFSSVSRQVAWINELSVYKWKFQVSFTYERHLRCKSTDDAKNLFECYVTFHFAICIGVTGDLQWCLRLINDDETHNQALRVKLMVRREGEENAT